MNYQRGNKGKFEAEMWMVIQRSYIRLRLFAKTDDKIFNVLRIYMPVEEKTVKNLFQCEYIFSKG